MERLEKTPAVEGGPGYTRQGDPSCNKQLTAQRKSRDPEKG